MSLYQRGSVWWIEVRDSTGKRIRESTGHTDRAKAQVYHDRREVELRAGIIERPTFNSASRRWFLDRKDKRSLDRDASIAKWLSQHWGEQLLAEIDDNEVRRVIEIKRQETTPSNANHYLAFIRALFNRAAEWGWGARRIQVKSYRIQNKRVRFLSEDEIGRLMRELPSHLKVMVEFSLLTGLRQSNVTGLRWDRIDVKRKIAWVDAADYKSGKDHAIPLSDQALQILEGERGKHDAYVFTYKGRRVEHVAQGAWKKALERARISDFRWHDLRHTFASYHAMNGTPLLTLKALGGWQSLEMVNRYAHLSAEGARQYVGNAVPLSGRVGETVGAV